MTKSSKMRFAILALFLVPLLGIGLTACEVRQTEEGALPDVDVDADVEPGNLPKFDVDAAEVEIGTEERRVNLPDVDVDMKERTIPLPDVDITPPDADPEVNTDVDLDINKAGDADTEAGESEPMQSQ